MWAGLRVHGQAEITGKPAPTACKGSTVKPSVNNKKKRTQGMEQRNASGHWARWHCRPWSAAAGRRLPRLSVRFEMDDRRLGRQPHRAAGKGLRLQARLRRRGGRQPARRHNDDKTARYSDQFALGAHLDLQKIFGWDDAEFKLAI
jgi:hypothetical protein